MPAARANGDPASDVLLTQKVFFPLDAPLPNSDREALQKTVDEANARGYPIRVALIPFTSDLGTAVSLWRHPQDYSKFLGSELAFVYAQAAAGRPAVGVRLLQPEAAGREGAPGARAGPGRQDAGRAGPVGDAAVRALAAADGHHAARVTKTKSTATGATALIIAASGLLILLIIFVPGRRLRRGRGDQPQPEQ